MLGRHKRSLINAVLIWIAMLCTYGMGRIDGYTDGYKAGLRHAQEMTTPNPSPSL